MINTPVMLNKRDKYIPKLMWAIVNKLISVVKINKLDIGLTKRARLDKSVIFSGGHGGDLPGSDGRIRTRPLWICIQGRRIYLLGV
jgi:hypothetical protein